LCRRLLAADGGERNAATPWNSASRGLAALPEFLFEPPVAAR
jgi:hypothetical protein